MALPESALPPSSGLHTAARFSNRADDYAKYRPSYPAAAIDAVLDGLGEASRLVVADVGAGTGIASRLVAERGAKVIAVEPNEEMRRAAASHSRVEFRAGTGEATGLADASVDVVMVAQAFHWFKQEAALAEFHRVLRAGGRVAIMWNIHDERDAFTAGYTGCIGEPPAQKIPFDPSVMTAGRLFRDLRLTEVAYEQVLDLEGLLGRALSSSYVPKEGEKWERLKGELERLYEKYRDERGEVKMRYVTKVYGAERE